MPSIFTCLTSALAATVVSAVSQPDVSIQLQSILNQAHTGLYTYPTSLTQGIVPVRFMLRVLFKWMLNLISRKDFILITIIGEMVSICAHYLYIILISPVPFYSALSVGCVSIEADVWLYNGTLYVGHEQGALTPGRTFDSLYIQPILKVLKAQNPTNSTFLTAPTRNGVFDTSGGQTLYLFVDLKTEGFATWPYVVKALEPL
jgi:hypothetical protein